MSSDPTSPHAAPAPGLPPVRPPTARFILELFLVPGLILVLIIGFWLFLQWLTGGSAGNAKAFLARLDDPNVSIRWRGASDLAQTLPRDQRLAADPDFALKLDQRLDAALKANEASERELLNKQATMSDGQKEAERARLRQEREYIQYLIACVGHFTVPTAVPLLRQVAEQDTGVEPVTLARRRRQAMFSLAVLGQNVTRYRKMRPEDRAILMNSLDKLRTDPQLGTWAEPAWENLRARDEGRGDSMGVEATLKKCAAADDPVLREYTAWVANFWPGTEKENAAIDEILVGLLHDNGHGDELRETLDEKQPDVGFEVRETPGYVIRVNAALALSRRGSHRIDGELGFLQELLDENNLNTKLRVSKSGQEEPNRAKVQTIMMETLSAIMALHAARPDLGLAALRPSIEALMQHGNGELAARAKNTLLTLDKKTG